jgi:hypothetical protein
LLIIVPQYVGMIPISLSVLRLEPHFKSLRTHFSNQIKEAKDEEKHW